MSYIILLNDFYTNIKEIIHEHKWFEHDLFMSSLPMLIYLTW